MIDYRHFRNPDVPALTELWNRVQFGTGAASEFSRDAYDMLVLAEPYFDRRGLIEAWDGKKLVGFCHAGFGPNTDGAAISKEVGILCAIGVHPGYRQQGIGRRLVELAEEYLRREGAGAIVAGESLERNPFYLGLYGGADCAGFLESDTHAAPFFAKLNYNPTESYSILARELQTGKTPFDPRGIAMKKQMKFGVLDRPPRATWWWLVRHGRFESLTFTFAPSTGGGIAALVTCWGMELHSVCRGKRTVGITDLFVAESVRRRGYAKVLLCEVLRRLREDGVTDVEVVIPGLNTGAKALFASLGFTQRDQGTVYRKETVRAAEQMVGSETLELPEETMGLLRAGGAELATPNYD